MRGRLPSTSPDSHHVPLAGQLVVFTGKLSSLSRKDARALVIRLGGVTADEVNAKTTMLVIGAEGFGPAPTPADDSGAARDKSNKLKRAEELNAERDIKIEILTEDEFCRLAGLPGPESLKRQYHAMRDLMARGFAVADQSPLDLGSPIASFAGLAQR